MRLLSTAALCLALATPALAFDPASMSDAERKAFGEAVRGYLLENPGVLMEAIAVLEDRNQQNQAANDQQVLQDNAGAIFNNANDWAGGNLQGDVTVVEFVDYRCGYCRKAFEEVEQLVENDGNLRIVMKEFPILGEDSLTSSKFAIAARKLGGDDTYKAAHDALITLRGPADAAALTELSKTLGLDYQAVRAEMDSDATATIIRENHELAAQLQINGTPTFIINETLVRGYVPLDGMRSVVAEQRRQN